MLEACRELDCNVGFYFDEIAGSNAHDVSELALDTRQAAHEFAPNDLTRDGANDIHGQIFSLMMVERMATESAIPANGGLIMKMRIRIKIEHGATG